MHSLLYWFFTGMENHCEETTMLRNACLTISHFDIPKDMLFAYDRVVAILLNVVRPFTADLIDYDRYHITIWIRPI